MTKEMSFLTTQAQESKNSTGKQNTAAKEVKSEPSLFDSMLGGLKQSEQKADVQAASAKKVLPEETTKTKVVNQSTPQKTETIPKENPKENSTLSLLDRLILDANTSIAEETQGASVESGLTTTPETTKNTSEGVVAKDTPTTDINVKENVAKDTTESKVTQQDEIIVKNASNPLKDKAVIEELPKKESTTATKEVKKELPLDKTPVSLLDKLVEQANTEIKEEAVKIPVPEASTTDGKEKAVVQNSDTTKAESEIKSTLTDGKNTTDKAVQTELKENIVATLTSTKEVQAVKETLDTTKTIEPKNKEEKSSLLDSMIKKANTQIDNENLKVSQNEEALQSDNVKVETDKKVSTQSNLMKNETIKQVPSSEVATKPVNEKVAQELAKISSAMPDKTVNISKEDIENLKSDKNRVVENKSESKSLLDKLVQETKVTIQKEETTTQAKESLNPLLQSSKTTTDPLLTNIYLSAQQKSINESSMLKNSVGKQMVLDATSLKDVQKSADFLELGLDEVEVLSKEEEFKNNVKADFLNKLSVTRDVLKQDLTKVNEAIVAQSSAATKTSDDTVVELTVSAVNVYNIENRIIGARQQMNSMMSDVARNMYLNYKPPVTAFRMQLNPLHLGSISVLIKNEKENGLTISLNMSNSATLDSFVDNQSSLRAALARNFSNETNFSLDFNMQEGGENKSFGDNNERPKQNHRSTNDVLERLTTKEEQPIKQSSNYM